MGGAPLASVPLNCRLVNKIDSDAPIPAAIGLPGSIEDNAVVWQQYATQPSEAVAYSCNRPTSARSAIKRPNRQKGAVAALGWR